MPVTVTVLVAAVLHWGVRTSLLASSTVQLIVREPLARAAVSLL